ncbi:hypothetical protein QC763_0008400 [Podospora pseudopauciseta]|uniref:Uncharacterized protein n=1 Tax=Podospora pseudopauciseta TaxID=2093780 RepID=A0ABR0HXP7_9PEZI|nr:hypothetical protein QC763_0008400 [Podospora pseudopauciseta]
MGDSGRIMACAHKNSVLSSDRYVRQLQYTASQQQDSHGEKHGQFLTGGSKDINPGPERPAIGHTSRRLIKRKELHRTASAERRPARALLKIIARPSRETMG